MPRKTASTEDAFLQTILDNPEDDVPRLVFADWLEEQGNPRGTFIRLQCQRARITRFDPGWAELLAEEARLYKQFEPEWSKPVLRLVDEVEYRRGFISHVRVTAAKFVTNADKLFRRAPIDSIRLDRTHGVAMPQLANRLGLGCVRELDLSENLLGKRDLEVLVESDACRNVRTLRLCRCGLREPSLRILMAAPHLASLESLNLAENDFGQQGEPRLETSSHFGKLRELNVHRNRISAIGAIQLANSAPMRLARLSLGANMVGNEDAADLARARCFADLQALDLETNHISNLGVESLVGSPFLTKLEYLNLAGNRISRGAIPILTESPLLANLTYLNLKHNDIDKDTLQTLPQRLQTPKMRELRF